MALETKAFAVKDLDLKETGEVAVAFAEVGAVDREKDYTFPGAIPTKSVPMSAYSHASWPQKGGLLPAGRGDIKEDGNLGVFRGTFFMKTRHGQDTYETVKGMAELQEWSYGYEVLEKAAPPAGVKALRGLKSLDIFELSPVLFGAGAATRTLDLKELTDPDELALLLKDGSLAGLTFAEMTVRVLDGLEAYTTRLKEVTDLRLKEGRAISTRRLEELAGGRGRLAEAIAVIDKIIEEATPKPKEDEAASAKARAMRMRSSLALASMELASIRT